MRVKAETGEVGRKQRYRVTNWSEYDRALVNRGNLTIWFDEASVRDSWTPPRPIGRGKPGLYSATAIQTCLTIKTLFRLPYRATEGLIKSLMRLCHLDLPVPRITRCTLPSATRQGGFGQAIHQTIQLVAIGVFMGLEVEDTFPDKGRLAGRQTVDFIVETRTFRQQGGRSREADRTLLVVTDGAHDFLPAFAIPVVQAVDAIVDARPGHYRTRSER